MIILAADTSTRCGGVALLDGLQVRAEWTLDSTVTHNRRLVKTIDEVLRAAGLTVKDLNGLAVTSGPGSFTGLRIGLTTVKTLAWAGDIPFAAIHTLDALAEPLRHSRVPVCALLDARKKEVFAAVYEPDGEGGLVRPDEGRVLPPARLAAEITRPALFCGDGWLCYQDLFRRELGELAMEAPPPYHNIRAATVAALARNKFLAGAADDPVTASPLYLRPSEAELKYPHLARS